MSGCYTNFSDVSDGYKYCNHALKNRKKNNIAICLLVKENQFLCQKRNSREEFKDKKKIFD